jgi:ceramide glucosyltransferase
VVVDPRRVGSNPKVNNLANLLKHARHGVIWISDSNTRVAPETLAELAAQLQQPGVGLVSSPFRGVAGKGLGGALESLQLNAFVMGGVAAVHQVLRGVCVVGKSMLLRRTTLDAIGGMALLSQYLAEDQVCGEEVARLGMRVVLARRPVDNVLGALPVKGFLARHLRWAKIRWRMSPLGYVGEALLNPILVAAVGALLLHNVATVAVFAAACLGRVALDVAAERAAGVARPLLSYLALVPLRDLLIGLAWPVPLVAPQVRWRGNTLRLGPRTRLVGAPQRATESLETAPATS